MACSDTREVIVESCPWLTREEPNIVGQQFVVNVGTESEAGFAGLEIC